MALRTSFAKYIKGLTLRSWASLKEAEYALRCSEYGSMRCVMILGSELAHRPYISLLHSRDVPAGNLPFRSGICAIISPVAGSYCARE